MPTSTFAGSSRHSPQHYQEILAELRQINHWRRLVAARLDLAIATVTDVDEPCPRALPLALNLPPDLRLLVGLAPAQPCREAAILEQLRGALQALDDYALALQGQQAAHPTAPRPHVP